jgi:hypothetical protein
MPYINRDYSGKLISVSEIKTEECAEFIEEDAPELLSLLFKLGNINLKTLRSDIDLIRVIEDLVDILVAKSLISINDLPAPVQKKLLSRKSLRVEGGLSSQHDLIEL